MPKPVAGFLQSVFWPIAVWPSFGRIAEHSNDDYVERTTPIIGTAIGFWACVAGLLLAQLATTSRAIQVDGIVFNSLRSWAGADTIFAVLFFFLPLLYVAGFWMFGEREQKYPN